MFQRIGRGWGIAKASWAVVKLHPKLLLLPIFSGIAFMLLMAAIGLSVFAGSKSDYMRHLLETQPPDQPIVYVATVCLLFRLHVHHRVLQCRAHLLRPAELCGQGTVPARGASHRCGPPAANPGVDIRGRHSRPDPQRAAKLPQGQARVHRRAAGRHCRDGLGGRDLLRRAGGGRRRRRPHRGRQAFLRHPAPHLGRGHWRRGRARPDLVLLLPAGGPVVRRISALPASAYGRALRWPLRSLPSSPSICWRWWLSSRRSARSSAPAPISMRQRGKLPPVWIPHCCKRPFARKRADPSRGTKHHWRTRMPTRTMSAT